MLVWPREVQSMTATEIQRAVYSDSWQRFRRLLKGMPTREKLDQLNWYLERRLEESGGEIIDRDAQVCVDNYINALLRGGQLVRDQFNIIRVQR